MRYKLNTKAKRCISIFKTKALKYYLLIRHTFGKKNGNIRQNTWVYMVFMSGLTSNKGGGSDDITKQHF